MGYAIAASGRMQYDYKQTNNVKWAKYILLSKGEALSLYT